MAARVTQAEGEEEVPTEILASSIVAISAGVKKLRSGRLNDRALILLIHDASGIGKPAIRTVLEALDGLEATFCKKRSK